MIEYVYSLFEGAEYPQPGFDNWEVITGHLDLLDLIILADVCTDARRAARLAFERKYAPEKFKLRINENEIKTSFEKNDRFGSIASLKFLRNFCDLICQMDIDTKNSSIENHRQMRKIIEYVNKFSPESRKELILWDYLPFLVENPFRNVDAVRLCATGYSVTEFNHMFMNVISLLIDTDQVRDYMLQRLPQLERIDILVVNSDKEEIPITYNDVMKATQMNPQIKELFFEQNFDDLTDNMLSVQVNGKEIEFHIDLNTISDGMSHFDFAEFAEFVRPQHFERMILDNTTGLNSTEVVKKFQNLECLIMTNFVHDLPDSIQMLPKLQDLQIWISDWLGLGDFQEIIDTLSDIFTSHAPHEQLSTLRPFIDLNIWRRTLSEDGPKDFKHSLVLKRIDSN